MSATTGCPKPTIRHLVPKTRWFVTTRCFQTMYLLRPDALTVDLVGLRIAEGLEKYPGVAILAMVQMTDHSRDLALSSP